jgi:hypothetical protein
MVNFGRSVLNRSADSTADLPVAERCTSGKEKTGLVLRRKKFVMLDEAPSIALIHSSNLERSF